MAHEIFRLTELDQLFTFLLHPEVPAHNNASEQTLRGPAQCRKLDRTSKTQHGCRRRSVITSYLETLSKQGQKTLSAITQTIQHLLQTGRSVLADQLEKARQSRQSLPRPSPI